MKTSANNRILIVDDNTSIHDDFRSYLSDKVPDIHHQFSDIEKKLFGTTSETKNGRIVYEIDSAYQGQDAYDMVWQARNKNIHYAMAFVDIRMPPGWDGVETIKKLWEIDPDIQMVICSAYSDYSWEEMIRVLGVRDNLLILKKPFDITEIRQVACALTHKWNLNQEVKQRTNELEHSLSLSNATLESISEGVLVVNKSRQIIKFNQLFLRLWGLDEAQIAKLTFDELIEFMGRQVIHSDLFIEIMKEIDMASDLRINNEYKLNSGKTFHFSTYPQFMNNKVIGSVLNFLDVTESKLLEEQLLLQATHDALTGLPNRFMLKDKTQQAILKAKQCESRVAIFLIDIDNFKDINDTMGHTVGDLLLRQVANRLSVAVRESDLVTRIGGDEFAIVCSPIKTKEEIIAVANKILKIFANHCVLNDLETNVSVSIGISVFPEDGDDYERLLQTADAALYSAKAGGKNSYQFYINEIGEHIMKRLELTNRFRQALEQNEFEVMYQPLIDLNTNRVVGMEGLVRWNHPTMGLLLPDKFIKLAEESDFIAVLGEWILKTVCVQTQKWHSQGYDDLRIAINVSIKQFKMTNFVSMIKKTLDETGLAPNCLELELTESIIIENVVDAVQKMMELKQLGIRLAIDDFGTGYSSLAYLRNMPIDKVKIDKEFISNLSVSTYDASIMEAIITMIKVLGKEVLAEGVEHHEQVEFLRKHCNSQAQGYYFSMPLSVSDFSNYLEVNLSPSVS